MFFRQIFDEQLAQYAYLVGCQRTREAILIDPERDLDRYFELAQRENLRITAVTETHIHADFVSGARELAARDPGVRLLLSDEGDADWKYGWPDRDARAWTKLHHGDSIRVGNVELRVVHSPGHTPEHIAFLVIDHGGGASEPMAMLAGDFVFVGDLGRPDLLESAAGVKGAMEPSARRLYASAQEFLALPEWIQVWPGHGAGSACGKALGAIPSSTVGYEKRYSPALAAVRSGEQPFVDFILAGQPEPPLYFARMKRWNRDGAPLLGPIPAPKKLDARALAQLVDRPDAVVIDTRRDRAAFCARHAARSIAAPWNRSFPSIVGSYVGPEEEIGLIVSEAQLPEAVLALIRIGYDRIAGWASPETLLELSAERLATIDRIGFGAEFEAARAQASAVLLDVRGAAEFEAGHFDGAVQIAHTRLATELESLPKDARLITFCSAGGRSVSAASFLARQGFEVVYVDGDHPALPRVLEPARSA